MTLLLTTLFLAIAFGYILFRIYHFFLLTFIKKMNWNLEELKTYTIREQMKIWDKVIEIAIIGVIIWRVFYTT